MKNHSVKENTEKPQKIFSELPISPFVMACFHYKKILFVYSELETHRDSLLSQVYNMLQTGNKQKSLFPKKCLKKRLILRCNTR